MAAAEEASKKKEMEGIASIALLPCGSISGHFIHLPNSTCYGLHGTELACERECSRGDDYRLINLNILDFTTQKEATVVVECKGHDAASWGNDVSNEVEKKQTKSKVVVSFECEELKADKAAEDHIRQFMPKLVGMDAVVNTGKMTIMGLDFNDDDDETEDELDI
ncbi:Pyridoxal phosphate homeostasis protein [Bienertia sinuspersici]